MTCHRAPRLLATLCFVSLCSACAGGFQQGPVSEAERVERISAAKEDLGEAKAQMTLLAAKRADERGQHDVLLRLAKEVYESGHFKSEAGALLGKAYGLNGQYSEQLEVYRELRALDRSAVSDDEFVGALAQALARIDRNDTDKRIELRLEIARLVPDHPDAGAAGIYRELEEVAQRHLREKNWKEALSAIEMLEHVPGLDTTRVRRSPAELAYARAAALWHLGHKERARQTFEAYIDFDRPAGLQARLRSIASFYAREDDEDAAVELYERALGNASAELGEEQLRLYYELADLLLRSSEHERRRRGANYLRYYVNHAARILPAHRKEDVFSQAGRLASMRGLTKLSDEFLAQAVEEGVASRYEVAKVYKSLLASGDEKKARAFADKYTNDGKDANSLWYAARWANESGKTELAYEYMKRALDLQPYQGSWWLEFARFAAKLDKKREALEAVRKHLDNGHQRSWDLQNAANMLKHEGMGNEALALVTDRYESDRSDANTAMYLASLLLQSGQRERALKVLVDLAERDDVRPHQLYDVARYVEREFGGSEAYPLYIASGDRGNLTAYISAAQIGLSASDTGLYDEAVEKLLSTDSVSSHVVYSLWSRLAPTNLHDQKIALLEKMIADPSFGDRYNIRGHLSHLYLAEGRGEEAFALWDDAHHQELADDVFESYYNRISSPADRRRLIDVYHKVYRDEPGSAWICHFVAELYYGQYWGARTAGSAKSAEAEEMLEKARTFYKLALERIPGSSRRNIDASTLLESRTLSKLAEEALVRHLAERERDEDTWLKYGSFLLRQGRSDAAEHVLMRYVNLGQQRGNAAVAVARLFADHQRAETAEKFYNMALVFHQNNDLDDGTHRNIAVNVGAGLGHLYLTSGRIDEFLELTSDYASKYLGDHPHLNAYDRRIDLNGLSSRGQWEAFVERAEKVAETGTISGLNERYAKALWYLGRSREAFEAFEKGYREHGGGAYHWMQLGEFLEARGGAKLAATAYDRAVRLSDSYHGSTTQMTRGQFLLRQGHYEAAIADFFAAAEQYRGNSRQVRYVMQQAFREAGREDLFEAALRREDSPFSQQNQGAPQKQARDISAEFDELSAEDGGRSVEDKVVERAEELAKDGVEWSSVLSTLAEKGHFGALAQIIEKRIGAGDFDAAAKLVMEHADGLASADRLASLIEQIDERRVTGERRMFRRLLVDHYLQNGQTQRALRLLAGKGNYVDAKTAVTAQLAQNEAALSAQSIEGWLSGYASSSSFRRRFPIAVDFLRFGKQEMLTSLLTRYSHLAAGDEALTDVHVGRLLEEGGAGAVVRYLQRVAEELADDTAHPASRAHTARDFVRGAAMLAAAGYDSELDALLDDLPESVRALGAISRMIERLAIFQGDVQGDAQGDAQRDAQGKAPGDEEESSASESHSWHQRMEAAQNASRRGDYEEAEVLLVDALKAALGHDDAQLQLAWSGQHYEQRQRQALRKLLRVYRANDDEQGVEQLVELWLDEVGRDNIATNVLIDALSTQGFDERAAKLARQVAEEFPVGTSLEKAVMLAAFTDDRDTVEALLPAYWRLVGASGAPIGSRHSVQQLVHRLDPQIAELFLERQLRARPKHIENRINQIVVVLRAGDVERARGLMAQYLEEFAGSNSATEALVEELVEVGFYVEVARVIAPALDTEAASAKVLHLIAEANAYIGRNDDAKQTLDTVLERGASPELEASKIAYLYIVAGHQKLGEQFVERAFSDDSPLSFAYLARGLSRLSGGKDGAVADIERGLQGRVGNAEVLAHIATVALRSEQYPVAETYLTRLMRLPDDAHNPQSHPLWQAINVMRVAEKERWGVEFLDRTIPGLMEQPYLVDSVEWTSLIGELLTDAGLGARADAWYARALKFHRLNNDSEYGVAELLDARALNLVVNDGDLDKALAMSREALTFSKHARPEFLVTLALAHTRRGDLAEATKTFRRAIRGGYKYQGSEHNLDAYLASVLENGTHALRPDLELRLGTLQMMKAYGERYSTRGTISLGALHPHGAHGRKQPPVFFR